MAKKKHVDAAARQRAYRARQRDGDGAERDRRNTDNAVTVPSQDRECGRHQHICQGLTGPLYVTSVGVPRCKLGACELCDAEREGRLPIAAWINWTDRPIRE